jgi:hypothetical protein
VERRRAGDASVRLVRISEEMKRRQKVGPSRRENRNCHKCREICAQRLHSSRTKRTGSTLCGGFVVMETLAEQPKDGHYNNGDCSHMNRKRRIARAAPARHRCLRTLDCYWHTST